MFCLIFGKSIPIFGKSIPTFGISIPIFGKMRIFAPMLQSVITVTPMLTCAFWTFVLLVDLKEHGDRGAHKQLLAWSLAATLLYMGHCAFFNKTFSSLPFFDALYLVCNLSVFPLYLRYLSKLTEGRVGTWMNWGVGLPPVAFGLVVSLLYLLMSEKETQSFVNQYLYHNSFEGLDGLARLQAVVHQTAKVVFAIGVCTTLAMGLRKIRRYNRLVDSIYADTEDKRLHSIGTLLLLLVLMSCISFVANAIGKHVFVDSNWMLGPTFLIFSVLLFALSYAGYRQVFSFEDIEQVETEAPAYIGNGLSDDIRKLIEKERIYLTHNLKVGDIATRLNTNSRYIQEALNVEMNVNFSDYINQLRVDYAEDLLKKEPDSTMEELIRRSGFSSSSTFYRNFKHIKGYRPKVDGRL